MNLMVTVAAGERRRKEHCLHLHIQGTSFDYGSRDTQYTVNTPRNKLAFSSLTQVFMGQDCVPIPTHDLCPDPLDNKW